MKQLAVLCIVLGVAATTLNYLRAERPEPEEKMILSIQLLDKPRSGWTRSAGKERLLASASVATPIGTPFTYLFGMKVKSQTGGADLESGTRASGKLTQRPDGRVHLALTFNQGSYVDRPGNADTDLVRTESLEVQCLLQPGSVKRIDCGNSQTCELRLEKLK